MREAAWEREHKLFVPNGLEKMADAGSVMLPLVVIGPGCNRSAAGPGGRDRDAARQSDDAVGCTAARGLDVAADPEPIAKQVVLLGDDGTITPLLSDEPSRALFLDERLRNRSTEVVGRRFAGVPYLQVVKFQVESEGRMRTPSIFATSARSVSVIHRFALVARARWYSRCNPFVTDEREMIY